MHLLSGGNIYRLWSIGQLFEMSGRYILDGRRVGLHELPGGQVRVRHGEYGLYKLFGKLLFVGRCGVLYRMRH